MVPYILEAHGFRAFPASDRREMMKRTGLFSLCLILVFCFLAVSCNQDIKDPSEGEDEPIQGTVTESLSSLQQGGKIRIGGIGPDTAVLLSDVCLNDGVYIEVSQKNGKGVSRGVGAENMFQREDGTLIPVPDENGNISFRGEDVGIDSDGAITVYKIPLQDDFEIRKGEERYRNKVGLAEELYYVDFTRDERFNQLDRSEIVLIKSGIVGAQGISVLQDGMLNCDIRGLLDFSEKWFDGFAVDMHLVFSTDSRDTDYMKLNVLKPVHAESESKVLDGDINVVYVGKQVAGQKYKVVVTFSGENAAETVRKIADDYNSLQLNPRYTDGSNRVPCVFPEFDPENRTITYHVDEVERPFMFNLDFNSDGTGYVAGTASIRLEQDEDGIMVHDMDDADDYIEILVPAHGILTWAYEAESDGNLYGLGFPSGRWAGVINRYNIDAGGGMGSGYSDAEEFYGSGFFILDNSDSDEDRVLLTLTRTVRTGIDCAVVAFNRETNDYVCVDADCPYCAADGKKRHYSHMYIIENRSVILTDTYWSEKEFGRYGRIGWGQHFSVRTTGDVALNTGTTGGRGYGYPIGTRVWNLDDSSTMIMIELEKIYTKSGIIVCNIALDGTDDFEYGVVLRTKDSLPENQIESVSVRGTPVVQREQTEVDPSGLQVVAVFSDGTTVDVTDSVTFCTDDDSSVWSNCIYYDGRTSIWKADYSDRKIKAVYKTGSGAEYAGYSEPFKLHARFDVNTHESAYAIPNAAGSYILLDVSGYRSPIAPYNSFDNPPTGFLIDGAGAGSNALMIFTYDQYVADTAVTIMDFGEMIETYGAMTEWDEKTPLLDWWELNGESTFLSFSVTGQGQALDAVVVYGQLANGIDPATGIKRTDFVEGSTKTYFVQTTSSPIKALDSISITRGDDVMDQRAFKPVNRQGYTVTAHYADGTSADVTDKAVFRTDKNESSWGNCLRYSKTEGKWVQVLEEHFIVASYSEGTVTKTAKTDTFPVFAAEEPGPENEKNPFVVENKAGSYVLMDVRGHLKVQAPFDETQSSGYFINGASKGTEVWVLFTKEEFQNKTRIKLDDLKANLAAVGPDYSGSSTTPPFGIYTPWEEAWTICFAVDGSGQGGDFVMVVGELAKDVDPEQGISMSDFQVWRTPYFITLQ